MDLEKYKKILIIGDAGRGKTAMAQKLSEKVNIPYYSMDNITWIKKFNEKRNTKDSIDKTDQIYSLNQWIVEGSSNYLIKPGINKAEIVFYLTFKNILAQWWSLIKRHHKRENETLLQLLKLLRHVFYKKYRLGYIKKRVNLSGLFQKYNSKIIYLYNHKDIDKLVL